MRLKKAKHIGRHVLFLDTSVASAPSHSLKDKYHSFSLPSISSHPFHTLSFSPTSSHTFHTLPCPLTRTPFHFLHCHFISFFPIVFHSFPLFLTWFYSFLFLHITNYSYPFNSTPSHFVPYFHSFLFDTCNILTKRTESQYWKFVGFLSLKFAPLSTTTDHKQPYPFFSFSPFFRGCGSCKGEVAPVKNK